MQLISTIFILINLFTRNFTIEKKILNSLFTFNLKQKKIILDIEYENKLNYFVSYDKDNQNLFIPFGAKKNIKPYKRNNNSSTNIYKQELGEFFIYKKDNNFTPLIKRSNSGKSCRKNDSQLNLLKKRNNQNKFFTYEENYFPKCEQNNSYSKKINNMSKTILLMKGDNPNSPKVKMNYSCKNKQLRRSHLLFPKVNNNVRIKHKDSDIIINHNFDVFYYFLFCRKAKKNDFIKLFNYTVNFYRSQMSIIHIFNLIFLSQIMITNFSSKKKRILNQTIEIPIIT
jgi:hypothetical protein